jgi:mono/diheme cytochrome c family protein
MKNLASLCLGAVMVASVNGAAADARSTDDAVYTESQAKSGARLYKEHCLGCHDKKYFGPVLQTWAGQSLGTFYMVMSATMPEANPGGLLEDEYVDVLAYIFSLNKFPAGDQALNRGALDEISIGGE